MSSKKILSLETLLELISLSAQANLTDAVTTNGRSVTIKPTKEWSSACKDAATELYQTKEGIKV